MRHFRLRVKAEALQQSSAKCQETSLIGRNYAAAWIGLAQNYISLTIRNLVPIDEGFTVALLETLGRVDKSIALR
jgi:hypothetical protein